MVVTATIFVIMPTWTHLWLTSSVFVFGFVFAGTGRTAHYELPASHAWWHHNITQERGDHTEVAPE
eukprot:12265587-Alexandrium_andersonii.AAC.1